MPNQGYWRKLHIIRALGRFGPQAKDAIPDLVPLLDDDREDIAEAAAAALAQIDPARFPRPKSDP
ncbi:MAG: HEAT repeat domain-containing protein [Gemmataceae bacterium]|nr:HEAT repeat domain-containing protein [Gemmataceae bacterium]